MSYLNPNRFEKILYPALMKLTGRSRYPSFTRYIGLKGTERVLEFGSGYGGFTPYLLKALPGGSVVCLDPCTAWIGVAKKSLGDRNNVTFINGTILTDHPGENMFDTVVIHFVLHDIPTQNRPETIAALSRSLVDNGVLYIREPCKSRHGIAPGEIDSLMSDAGLVKDETKSAVEGKTYTAAFRKIRH